MRREYLILQLLPYRKLSDRIEMSFRYNYRGGLQLNNAIRTKFFIDNNSDYTISLWQKSVDTGRSIITVPLKITIDGKLKLLLLQELVRGKWVEKSRSKTTRSKPIPLYLEHENDFEISIVSCFGRRVARTCELRFL